MAENMDFPTIIKVRMKLKYGSHETQAFNVNLIKPKG
jgi:hypothetical protein